MASRNTSEQQALPSPSRKDLVFTCHARVEIVDGRKVCRFRFPSGCQGHTFAIHLRPTESSEEPSIGPFEIEYVLCHEFLLHKDGPLSLDLAEGFSNLTTSERLAKATIIFHYTRSGGDPETREGRLRFVTADGRVTRLAVRLPETELTIAIRIAGQFVSNVLDILSFRRLVPLQVRNVEVRSLRDPKGLVRYLTLPYGDIAITEQDVKEVLAAPTSLVPALRLFREGLSSAKPHYRLLCLYRVREVLQPVQKGNARAILKAGRTLDRPARRLPDNELTRSYFPTLVGKKLNAFFDRIRLDYRLPIAHVRFDEYDRLLLDPAYVRTDHRIDYTNAVLLDVDRILITDEWELMRRHGLVGLAK